MNNTIPNVPRELLEELRDATNEGMNATTRQHQIDYFAGLIAKADALLSTPSPAGVDGLEVAATYVQEFMRAVPSGLCHITDGDQLCRLSDAQAIIDGLRGEVEHLRHGLNGDYDLDSWLEWCTKRDQQAKRIGELTKDRADCLDARHHYAGKFGEAIGQRDQLAGLLREIGDWVNDLPIPTRGATAKALKIDAALAELK